MKVRSVIILNDYSSPLGGSSKVAFESAVALKKCGYSVLFVSGTGEKNKLHAKEGVHSFCLNQPDMLADKSRIRAAFRSIWNMKAYKVAKKLACHYSAEDTVVMVHSFSKTLSSSVFSAFKGSRIKVLYFIHDYFPACPNGGFHNYQKHENCSLRPMSMACLRCNCDVRSYPQKLYRCVRQFFIRMNMSGNSSNLYAFNVSDLSGEKMKPYIASRFASYNTLVNPVDINTGEYVDITRNENYLFIGRLSEEKGIREFCKVITELRLKGLVMGDGYLLDEMKAQYPNIQFAGWVDSVDRQRYIQQAKCLLFPSKVNETFGLAVPEMLSFGIPCIMPLDCGASYLIKDGTNGFTFPMGSYAAFKDCVERFEQTDLKEIMIKTRKSFNRFQYSPQQYVENLQGIFENL